MDPAASAKVAGAELRQSEPQIDFPTIAAIGVVVYICSSILHEGFGHGLACVLVGGKVARITSTFCSTAGPLPSPAAIRIFSAAGTMMNILVASFAWLALKWSQRGSCRQQQYFLWLTFAVNGLNAAGYLAVPTMIGFGDWMGFLQGRPHSGIWRVALVGAGVLLYVGLTLMCARELRRLTSRLGRNYALRLAIVPYALGGIVYCAAGLLNPAGAKIILISAAASSFGGTAGLPWIGWMATLPSAGLSGPPESVVRVRDWWWIVAAVVATALFIFVLGPGVKF